LPYLINRADGVVSASLEIYTISGRRVHAESRELLPPTPAGPFEWDGRLRSGEVAASGIYGYVIRIGGERRSGRFLLLR
jgi:hypothetical protein